MSATLATKPYRAVTVHNPFDECSTAIDVMQLVMRLPYLEALAVARTFQGDVDKIVDGAANFLSLETTDDKGR